MWWYRFIAVGLALATLSACGFEPVYRQGSVLQERLDLVYVDPIQTRVGQAARNTVLDTIGASDRNADAKYRLTMTIIEDRERVGIQADETASRVNLVLNTVWRLTHVDKENTLIGKGSLERTVPYNVVEDDYASLVAERDAERLAGRLTGEAVRRRVILLLRPQ